MPLLVAQMGHVGRTSGATGTSGEQAMTASVGKHLAATAPSGWQVRLIHADVADAAYKGDAFVAIHGDGSTNRSVRGASAGYRTTAGGALAKAWKAAYVSEGWPGTFHADNYTSALSGYYGVRHAIEQGNDAAFVLEVGMMTNPTDRAWIDANHAAIARSIWKAVAGTAGGSEDVADHIYLVVTDQGEAASRLALVTTAKQQKDHYEEGAVTFAVHTSTGPEADAYINIAKARVLDCQSVYTTGPAHTSMVVRNRGVKPAGDVTEYEAKLDRIHADALKIVEESK